MGRLTRLAAATALVAAAGVTVLGVATAAPAQAAGCSSATGVTVVVDFNVLGGGVQEACDAGGAGKDAASLFSSNGFSLTYVLRQPGFVCRIDGAPASDPCVNTPPSNAYWGLYWSDGRSGSWVFSSLGAGSLTVPDGGYVAFAWQSGSGQSTPGVPPTPHATTTPTPTPTTATPTPSHSASPTRSPAPGHSSSAHPSAHPSSGNSSGHPTTSASPTSSASVTASTSSSTTSTSATPSKTTATSSPSDSGSASTAAAAPTASDPTSSAAVVTSSDPATTPAASSSHSHALPTWLVLVVLAGLLVLVVGVGVARQAQTSRANNP